MESGTEASGGGRASGDDFGWWAETDGNQIIVGAPFHGGTGSAYVFARVGDSWIQTGKLVGSDSAGGDAVGYWVSIQGEWAAVGARYADATGPDSGAAYLFHRQDGVWSQYKKYVANDTQAGDQFGFVSLDQTTITFGALGNDNEAGIDAGAAYVTSLPVIVPPPVAAFEGAPLRGKAPLTVCFADSSSGVITGRLWDFGNGYYSSVSNPILTFYEPGTYSIELTVLGPGGASCLIKERYVEVLPRGPQAQQSTGP